MTQTTQSPVPVTHLRSMLAPSELTAALVTCFKAGRCPMLHGDPGTGKSEMVQQVADSLFAEAYGYKLADGVPVSSTGEAMKKSEVRPWFKGWRTATKDAVDLAGLPGIKNGKTFWATPEDLPTDPRGGILFFDEINRGPEATTNACFNVVDRVALSNGYVMPSAWIPAAAINDKDAGVRKLPSALTRRFQHYYVGGEVTDRWLKDVCKIGASRNWHPMVLAFLRSFPVHLNRYDAKELVSPNPRGWEFVSDLMWQNPPVQLLYAHVCGTVGDTAAREFVAFSLLWKNLPNLDDILIHPLTAPVPTQASVVYAVVSALARRANEKTWPNVMKYAARLPMEYCVALVMDATHRTPALKSTPEFTNWAIAHQEVIF